MTMEIAIQIGVSLLLFAGVFLLIWAVFRYPVPVEPPIHRRIAVAVGVDTRKTLFEAPLLAPVMNLALNAAARIGIPALRNYTRQHLDAAGNPSGYSVNEYLAICLLCSWAMGLGTALLALLPGVPLDPLLIFIMTLLGFYGPLSTAKSMGASRVMRISKQLPYSMDLIALMMGAGATFTEAVTTLIKDEPQQDFNQEMRIVLAEIEFGAKRSEALAHLAERIPLESLRSVVGAVNQAESMGSPLSQILKNQSDMMRMHRSVRAEKLSASASLRILVPSMLILVAVLLVLFGPMIVRFSKDGLF